MKVGIDSYCYHRFFGEVYPQQVPPQRKMTLEDFLDRANELGEITDNELSNSVDRYRRWMSTSEKRSIEKRTSLEFEE